ALYARGKILIDGHDDFGIPKQHLLDGHDRQPTLTISRHVARAEKLDCLHIDRTAEPGLEPARPARVIHTRPPLRRYLLDAAFDRRHRFVGVAGERLGFRLAMDEFAELAVARHDRFEAAVEQRVGNAGLLLHSRGERDEGRTSRTDIENEI